MASDTSPLLPNWRASKVALATVFVVLVGVAFWLLFRFRMVLFALFVALVISTAITPGVEWLHRRGLPRPVGVILIYLLIIALLAGFVWLVAPLIFDQVAGISEELPAYYQQLRGWLVDSPSFLIRIIGARLPQDLVLIPFAQPAPLIDPESPVPEWEWSRDAHSWTDLPGHYIRGNSYKRALFRPGSDLAGFLLDLRGAAGSTLFGIVSSPKPA
jgi:hypothetical protein